MRRIRLPGLRRCGPRSPADEDGEHHRRVGRRHRRPPAARSGTNSTRMRHDRTPPRRRQSERCWRSRQRRSARPPTGILTSPGVPSDRMHNSATVTTRSTNGSGGSGTNVRTAPATAAPTRNNAGAGTWMRSAQPGRHHRQQPDQRGDQNDDCEGEGVDHVAKPFARDHSVHR